MRVLVLAPEVPSILVDPTCGFPVHAPFLTDWAVSGARKRTRAAQCKNSSLLLGGGSRRSGYALGEARLSRTRRANPSQGVTDQQKRSAALDVIPSRHPPGPSHPGRLPRQLLQPGDWQETNTHRPSPPDDVSDRESLCVLRLLRVLRVLRVAAREGIANASAWVDWVTGHLVKSDSAAARPRHCARPAPPARPNARPTVRHRALTTSHVHGPLPRTARRCVVCQGPCR